MIHLTDQIEKASSTIDFADLPEPLRRPRDAAYHHVSLFAASNVNLSIQRDRTQHAAMFSRRCCAPRR